jgi:hypothetical protein
MGEYNIPSPLAQMRTKLSSKATPFRPILSDNSWDASTSDDLSSSHNFSELDISTGSISSLVSSEALLTRPSYLHPHPGAAEGGDGSACSGEFKLGDFRSRLLKRAQIQSDRQAETITTQAENHQEMEFTSKFEQSLLAQMRWPNERQFAQALRADVYSGPRNATRKWGTPSQFSNASSKPPISLSDEFFRCSDRQQAMAMAAAEPKRPHSQRWSEMGLDMAGPTSTLRRMVPLPQSCSFTEGMTSPREDQKLPVRNTFIHFDEGDTGLFSSAWHCLSAPAILSQSEVEHSKYPVMEPAHIRGECRPCVYFTKKADGCRWGAECEFCHLCPEGSLQRKKKEKVKAIREQEHAEKRHSHGGYRRSSPAEAMLWIPG